MGVAGSVTQLPARRRSGRLPMRLNVVVSGTDGQGQAFEEHTETLEISKYGAKVLVTREFKIGAMLSLHRPDTDARSKFRVVYQGSTDASTGRRELGIEFIGVDSFWGIQFPPDKSMWS